MGGPSDGERQAASPDAPAHTPVDSATAPVQMNLKILGAQLYSHKSSLPSPYCSLTITGDEAFSAKTNVLQKTVAPDWQESFNFTVSAATSSEAKLVVSVWDSNDWSRNACIGVASVPLCSFASGGVFSEAVADTVLPLMRRKRSRGELRLQGWRSVMCSNAVLAACKTPVIEVGGVALQRSTMCVPVGVLKTLPARVHHWVGTLYEEPAMVICHVQVLRILVDDPDSLTASKSNSFLGTSIGKRSHSRTASAASSSTAEWHLRDGGEGYEGSSSSDESDTSSTSASTSSSSSAAASSADSPTADLYDDFQDLTGGGASPSRPRRNPFRSSRPAHSPSRRRGWASRLRSGLRGGGGLPPSSPLPPIRDGQELGPLPASDVPTSGLPTSVGDDLDAPDAEEEEDDDFAWGVEGRPLLAYLTVDMAGQKHRSLYTRINVATASFEGQSGFPFISALPVNCHFRRLRIQMFVTHRKGRKGRLAMTAHVPLDALIDRAALQPRPPAPRSATYLRDHLGEDVHECRMADGTGEAGSVFLRPWVVDMDTRTALLRESYCDDGEALWRGDCSGAQDDAADASEPAEGPMTPAEGSPADTPPPGDEEVPRASSGLRGVATRVSSAASKLVQRVSVDPGAMQDDSAAESASLPSPAAAAAATADLLRKLQSRMPQACPLTSLSKRMGKPGGHASHRPTHAAIGEATGSAHAATGALGFATVLIRRYQHSATAPKLAGPVACAFRCGPVWGSTYTPPPQMKPANQWNWQVHVPVYEVGPVFSLVVAYSSQSSQKWGRRHLSRTSTSIVGKLRIRLNTLVPGSVVQCALPVVSSKGEHVGTLDMDVGVTYRSAGVLLGGYVAPPLPPDMYELGLHAPGPQRWLRRQKQAIIAHWLEASRPGMRHEVTHYLMDREMRPFQMRRMHANIARIKRLIALAEPAAEAWGHIQRWEEPWHTMCVLVALLVLFFRPGLGLSVGMVGAALGVIAHRRAIDPPPSPPHMLMASAKELKEGPEDMTVIDGTSNPVLLLKKQYASLTGRLADVVGHMDAASAAVEKWEAMMTWQDPAATAVVVIVLLIKAAVLYYVPLPILLAAAACWVLRPPSLRDAQPPIPLFFVGRMPCASDQLT